MCECLIGKGKERCEQNEEKNANERPFLLMVSKDLNQICPRSRPKASGPGWHLAETGSTVAKGAPGLARPGKVNFWGEEI